MPPSAVLLHLCIPVTSGTDRAECSNCRCVHLSAFPSTSDNVFLLPFKAPLAGPAYITLCCHLGDLIFTAMKSSSSPMVIFLS